MSAPPAAKSKQGSRWGSLLSGAVAGLESRLDTILAEDSGASARSREAEKALQEAKAALKAADPGTASTDTSRSASRNRVNDRLAERLAKAVASQKSGSQAPSEVPSRTGSPVIEGKHPRASLGSRPSTDVPQSTSANEESGPDTAEVNEELPVQPEQQAKESLVEESSTLLTSSLPLNPALVPEDAPPTPLQDQEKTAELVAEEDTAPLEENVPPAKSIEELGAEIAQMQADHAEAEKQRQEEMNAHLERIDALQAKLQYLAKETVAAAKEANASAVSGSLEQKLAEKEERIAVLMEEGTELSKKELRLNGIIKTLRTKASQEEKNSVELRKKLTKAEQTQSELRESLRRAETTGKQNAERLKRIPKLERDLDATKSELESSKSSVVSLRTQLADAERRAEEAETKAQNKVLEADAKKISSLQEELESVRIEKKLSQDRSNAEIRRITEEAERQKARAAALESELRSEISNLESYMEAVRARAEEATSDTAGDSQAKLLRQVETLQTQYSLAAENWRTIEGSLNARVAALEKERDEANKREADIRKKAREINTKSRRLEEDLESATEQSRALTAELESQRTEVQRLQSRLKTFESALEEAKADFDRQRRIWDSELHQRLEEERARVAVQSRTESPVSGNRQASTQDPLHMRRNMPRLTSHDTSRRSSALPSLAGLRSPGVASLTPDFPSPSVSRQESIVSLSHLVHPNGIPPTPSIHTENVDPNDDMENHSSPQRTINDVISASTVHTGPSVALVERLTSSIRRLESEKAAHKDELARMLAQRDEARDEVVTLMREVEGVKKDAGDKERTEKELRELRKRYEACLEMLGEREEEVVDLRGDVNELKRIYRDLCKEMGR